MTQQRSAVEKTLDKIQVDPESGCWEFQGARSKGYGRVWNGKRMMPAHRVVFEAVAGPIPDGLQADHLCRNRACCNPRHIDLVTSRENTLRGYGPTAQNSRKTHCKNGHPLVWMGIARRCPVCWKQASRRNYEENRKATLERDKVRYWENHEAELERARTYHAANREKINARHRARYKAAMTEKGEDG